MKKRRITMEDHRLAVGRGVTIEEYAKNLRVSIAVARKFIGQLTHLPAVTVDEDGIIRWIP